MTIVEFGGNFGERKPVNSIAVDNIKFWKDFNIGYKLNREPLELNYVKLNETINSWSCSGYTSTGDYFTDMEAIKNRNKRSTEKFFDEIIKENIMNDAEEIQYLVKLYVQSMDESDPEKVRQVFHANAKVVGYLHGDFLEMSVGDFASFVEAQKPSPKEKNENVVFEILSCEVDGTTASVKVRDKYLGITFLDTLSFIKVENEWALYNKLFHVENE